MKFKQAVLVSGLSAAVTLGGLAIAQGRPVENVGGRHPNIDAAQHLVDQAYNRITMAQRANEFDLGGHAAHAKDLLDQANRELKAAAETSNHR